MTVEVTEVHPFNVARGELEAAGLWHAIAEERPADREGEWVPEPFRATQRPRRAGVQPGPLAAEPVPGLAQESRGASGGAGEPGFQHRSRWTDPRHMMILDTVKRQGRLDGQRGRHLVHVELVENAPWNRSGSFAPPRCPGIAGILVGAAVAPDEKPEFHGRTGFIRCRKPTASMPTLAT